MPVGKTNLIFYLLSLVARKCFGELLGKEEAQIKLKKMIPTHDLDLRVMKEEVKIAKYRELSHSAEKALGLLRD